MRTWGLPVYYPQLLSWHRLNESGPKLKPWGTPWPIQTHEHKCQQYSFLWDMISSNSQFDQNILPTFQVCLEILCGQQFQKGCFTWIWDDNVYIQSATPYYNLLGALIWSQSKQKSDQNSKMHLSIRNVRFVPWPYYAGWIVLPTVLVFNLSLA